MRLETLAMEQCFSLPILFHSHRVSCSESQVQCCCRQLNRVMERLASREHNKSECSWLAATFSSIIKSITVTVCEKEK